MKFARSLFLLALGLTIPSVQAQDFDADGRDDLALFDSSSSQYLVRLTTKLGALGGNSVGPIGSVPAPGDYDGDGVTDQATFDRSTGEWNFRLTSNGRVTATFGSPGDYPVPARYSGYACSDMAVYTPASGKWVIANCQVFGPPRVVQWGGLPGDIPVPGDYDGDKLADLAVVDTKSMTWRIWRTRKGVTSLQFGLAGDIPMPADYDGDGIVQPAVFRPSTQQFIVSDKSGQIFVFPAPEGRIGDQAFTDDVDADGKADLVSFNPTALSFDIAASTLGVFGNIFIQGYSPSTYAAVGTTDVAPLSLPLPLRSTQFLRGGVVADLNRDLRSEFMALRSSGGLKVWVGHDVLGPSYFYTFGFSGDVPFLADIDGDLRSEPVVARTRSDGGVEWLIRNLNGMVNQVFFGLAGDVPIVGDFDCDNKADLAVTRRSSTGGLTWFFRLSSEVAKNSGTIRTTNFGLANDYTFAADINGDSCDELVVAQNVAGGWQWFSRPLKSTQLTATPWGLVGQDTPLPPIDLDGDGLADPVVARQANGAFTVLGRLASGEQRIVQVPKGALPLLGYFSGLPAADVASIFPPAAGVPSYAIVTPATGSSFVVGLGNLVAGDTPLVYHNSFPPLLVPGGTPSGPVAPPAQCSVQLSFVDGQNGRLWKPISESKGKPVIVLPRSYWTDSERIEVYDRNNTRVANAVPRSCCHNGDRGNFDVPRPTSELAAVSPLLVRIVLKNGETQCLNVPDASKRYD